MLNEFQAGQGGARARRSRPAVLVFLAAAGLLGGLSAAWAQQPAPINRRFEVHRTDGGFALAGFRAEVGQADRFVLTAGMPALQARQQMLSVQWGDSYGLLDPLSLAFGGRRVRFQDVTETVTVVLDPAGQFVRTVVYDHQPALYSRPGLLRYLYAAFREGQPLVEQENRIVIEYPRSQTLRIEATRLPDRFAQWRIVYRIDVASPSAGPAIE